MVEIDWSVLAGEAVTQLIKIFVPVLVVLVLKWIVEIWKRLNEKNPQAAEILAYAARIGYAAAEDYFRQINSADGSDKMDYAIHRASEYLTNLGLNIDTDVIRDAITQYGVSDYKFSWTKPSFEIMFGGEQSENPEEEEVDSEPDITGDLCIGSDRNCDHADRDAGSEQPAGSAEGIPENQDGK